MRRKSAYILFLAVLGLLVIGIVMLFSTSAFARDSHGDVYFFIRRQAIWFGVGLAVCIVGALTDYHFWQLTWWLWFTLALVALLLCYFPHIGMRLNGSRRWIAVGPVTFQPRNSRSWPQSFSLLPGLRDAKTQGAMSSLDSFFPLQSLASLRLLFSEKSIWGRRS